MDENILAQVQEQLMKQQKVTDPAKLDIAKVVGKHKMVIDGVLRNLEIKKDGSIELGAEVPITITPSQLRQAIEDGVEHGQSIMAHISLGGKVGTKPLDKEAFAKDYVTQKFAK